MFNVVFISYNESLPLQSLPVESEAEIASRIAASAADDADEQDDLALNVIPSLLVRSVGLYVHHNPATTQQHPNERATRLAMACGLLSMRLRGNVIVSFQQQQQQQASSGDKTSLEVDAIVAAACGSHDLRPEILSSLLSDATTQDDDSVRFPAPPEWLANASRENYHDAAVLQRLAAVMNQQEPSDDDDDGDSNSSGSSTSQSNCDNDKDQLANTEGSRRTFVTTVPLCLECRRPASELCPDCGGAYFCARPAPCRANG